MRLIRTRHRLFANNRPGVERLEDRTTPAGSNLIAFGANAGGLPYIRVYDPQTDTQVRAFLAYDASFAGGVHVAEADVNTGAGPGGGPHVKVFDGKTGATLASYYAYDASFGGGVSVAAADLDNDGAAEVITGAGPGGGPHVRVFGGLGGLKTELFAFDASFKGGVDVSAGDVNGDGTNDILAAQGPGGSTLWRAF